MKTIITSILLAVIGLLCGCANLGSLGTLMQPRDPNVVSAEASASSAEKWVSTFLSYVKANPQLGLMEKGAAEDLTRSFDPDLKNLYGLLALYKKNPMANAGPLSDAKQRVEAHEGVAKRIMNGGDIRGQGAPFAPPIGAMPPPPAQTIVVNQQDQIVKKLDDLQRTLAQGFHMVWTNQQARATNAQPHLPSVTNSVPPAPPIPK